MFSQSAKFLFDLARRVPGDGVYRTGQSWMMSSADAAVSTHTWTAQAKNRFRLMTPFEIQFNQAALFMGTKNGRDPFLQQIPFAFSGQ